MKETAMPRLRLFALLGTLVLVLAASLGVFVLNTEQEIDQHRATIRHLALSQPARAVVSADLPAPVQRYLAFALPNPQSPRYRLVTLAAEGQFRRPRTEGFAPTGADQTIATTTPALMFAATAPLAKILWARAYDFFAEGRMEMRAKLLSAVPVVSEHATEALNRTSLQRWLLESPLYPMALLPGGPVRWEAINDSSARAIVSGFGLEAALIAHFRPDGSLAKFVAERDGDLTTPYHGAGEVGERDDYRLVQGMMIPHRFTMARAAGGQTYPFWTGQITRITFE